MILSIEAPNKILCPRMTSASNAVCVAFSKMGSVTCCDTSEGDAGLGYVFCFDAAFPKPGLINMMNITS